MIKSPFAKLPFKTRGLITLAGGFLIHFILGTFYLWGSVSTYISSYLQNKGQNYSNNDVGAVFPFMMLAINIGNPFGVTIASKIGYRLQAIICSCFIGIAIFSSSYALSNFPLFTFLYGFVFGVFNGLVYMLPFNLCYIYFPEKKGLVSGVISGGFGFGATVFIWLVYALVNPDDEKAATEINGGKYYSPDVCENLPKTIRVLGIIYFVIAIIGSLLIEQPTKEELEEIEHQHAEEQATLLQADPNHQPIQECKSLKDGFKIPLIYISLLLTATYASFGAMIVANYKSFGQTFNYTDSYLSAIGTVGSVANGLSRFFWGSLLQKISYKYLVIINLSFQILISFTLRWVGEYSALYFIYITLAYFNYGGWYAVQPATITKIFGKKIGTTVYGVTFTGFTVAGWIQFFVVKEIQTALGWGNMFWVFSGFLLFGLILTFFVKFEINWKQFYRNQPSEDDFEHSTKSDDVSKLSNNHNEINK